MTKPSKMKIKNNKNQEVEIEVGSVCTITTVRSKLE
jgi:hypothetical protein